MVVFDTLEGASMTVFPSVLRPLNALGANGVVVAEEASDCTLYDKYIVMSSCRTHGHDLNAA